MISADDLALLSHKHQQMNVKTDRVAVASSSAGLYIKKEKTRSPNTTRRATESQLVEKLLGRWDLTRSKSEPLMDKEDAMQT